MQKICANELCETYTIFNKNIKLHECQLCNQWLCKQCLQMDHNCSFIRGKNCRDNSQSSSSIQSSMVHNQSSLIRQSEANDSVSEIEKSKFNSVSFNKANISVIKNPQHSVSSQQSVPKSSLKSVSFGRDQTKQSNPKQSESKQLSKSRNDMSDMIDNSYAHSQVLYVQSEVYPNNRPQFINSSQFRNESPPSGGEQDTKPVEDFKFDSRIVAESKYHQSNDSLQKSAISTKYHKGSESLQKSGISTKQNQGNDSLQKSAINLSMNRSYLNSQQTTKSKSQFYNNQSTSQISQKKQKVYNNSFNLQDVERCDRQRLQDIPDSQIKLNKKSNELQKLLDERSSHIEDREPSFFDKIRLALGCLNRK